MKHKYKIIKELPTNALTTSLIYDLWSDYFDTVHYEVYLNEDTQELVLVITQNGDCDWKLFLIKIEK